MEPKVTEGQGFRPETLLKTGANIALVKRGVLGQQASAIAVGQALVGKLVKDIRLGETAQLESGNTSPVQSVLVNQFDGRISIDTQTSRYELLDKSFKGLDIEMDRGSIHLPVDSQPARLANRVVDMAIPGGGHVYINKPALRDVLLETHGAHVFRAVDFRFMVLARVGNIHLPFYVSLEGTSGKNAGEWYPFFGYNGAWVIKGSEINEKGEMNYQPKIDKVRKTLNRNLVLPNYMSRQGKLGNSYDVVQEPTVVNFDINDHLGYRVVPTWSREEEKRFVSEMTGYHPTAVTRTYESATPWINAVVGSIK